MPRAEPFRQFYRPTLLACTGDEFDDLVELVVGERRLPLAGSGAPRLRRAVDGSPDLGEHVGFRGCGLW
jgi:hypothetical protein